MSKRLSITILDTRKDFWKQCVKDATVKIKKAKQRVQELEIARDMFRKNAIEGAEMPGEISQSVGQTHEQQHSV